MSDETRKTLALISHDGKKADMVAFAIAHRDVLARYDLVATRTTGQLLRDKCGLEVKLMLSGPLGGDCGALPRTARPPRQRQVAHRALNPA